MRNHHRQLLSLRVMSDNMYDPANPRSSFMAGDRLSVDPDMAAEDGDFVVVASERFKALMKFGISEGKRCFRYIAPDEADFCLTDSDVSIVGVVTERSRLYRLDLVGSLKWLGDDIGLCNDSPICVNLADQSGRSRVVSLREALTAYDRIDVYGWGRICTALSFSAQHGYLRRMDLDVWNEFKADHSVELEDACYA